MESNMLIANIISTVLLILLFIFSHLYLINICCSQQGEHTEIQCVLYFYRILIFCTGTIEYMKMFKEDDFAKKISMKFIQTLNRHLPVKRKTLKELLSEDKPAANTLDGSIHCFDKKELEKL